MQEDKRFPNIHVFGLFGVELADDHDAAKDEQNEENEHEPVLAQEIHQIDLREQRSQRKMY
jgi:hypothetical protein